MSATTAIFCESLTGSPNLALWPAQTVTVTIYAKVESPLSGVTYKVWPRLSRGQYRGVDKYYDTSDGSDPAVPKQAITTSWALYTFNVPTRELTGPTSDRLFLGIGGEGGPNIGGYIHIGSDGGSNQTAVYPNFDVTPFQPKSLRRNPDYGRPTQVVSYTTGSSTKTFYSLPSDPSLSIWKKRVWRPKIWAKVTGGTADIYATIGRTSGSPITLANDVYIGRVTSNSWTLFKKDILINESTGSVTDVVFLGVRGVCTSGAILQVGVGLNHPSVINSPLLSFPGNNPTTGTFKDELVAVESGAPARFLRENVDSSNNSINFAVTSEKRLDVTIGSGAASIEIPVADSYTGSAGTNQQKYAQEGHSHKDRGYVVAVGDDIPDVLYNRIVVKAPLSETVIGTAPIRQVQISLDQEDPAVTGSYLYPAEIEYKKLQRAKCILAPLDIWEDVATIGFGYTPFPQPGGAWSQTAPGVWQKASYGPIDPGGVGYFDYVEPYLGMRFLFRYAATGYESYHGVYVITHMGSDTEYATFQRANDASDSSQFTYGKPVYVVGGNSDANHTFRYDGIDNPILGTTNLTFYDGGTNSIYAHGFFGFGSVYTAISGLYTWGSINEIMGGGSGGGGLTNGSGPGVPIWGLDNSGGKTIPINVGDKFLVWVDNDIYNEAKYFGLYELVSTLDQGVSPVIRRVDTANEPIEFNGLVVKITDLNALYSNYYFSQTANITAVDFTNTAWSVSSIPPEGTEKLLTSSQLVTEGASNTTQIAAFPIGNLVTDDNFIAGIPTLLGTPGLSAIPAGKYKFSIKAFLSTFNPAFETKVHIKLHVRHLNGSDDTAFIDAYSPPIRKTTPTVYTFEAVLASPIACLSTDRISWSPWFSTNSTDVITASLQWQDDDRDTWIQTPIQFGSFGTLDHYQLDNRFPDVGLAAPPAHNWNGIGPTGFAHTAFGTDTAVAGWLPSPNNNNMLVTIDGSNLLQGIGTANKIAGDIVILTFLQPLRIIHNASVGGHSGFAPLYLTWSGANPQNIDWYTNTVATNRRKNCIAAFRLRTDGGISPSPCWELLYQKSGEPV